VAEIPQHGNFYLMLGEPNGIGASCGLLRYHYSEFLLDTGTEFGTTPGSPIQRVTLPFGEELANRPIRAIFISHAHQDHTGYLPHVIAMFPKATIIMTRDTFRILKVMFPDSLKISNEEAEKAHWLGFPSPQKPFTEEEMWAFFNMEGTPRLRLIDTSSEIDDLPGLHDWNFKFRFSGHTTGSFSMFMTAPDRWTCYWTGDAASHKQEICNGVGVPEGWENPDTLITEATNGALPMSSTRAETWTKYDKIVLETIANGGHVLCPAFAVNRISNVTSHIMNLAIQHGFKVVVDGLVARGEVGERIIDIELGTERVEKWVSQGHLIIINQEDVKYVGMPQRHGVLSGHYGPAVILSSSATMQNGWSAFWAMNLLYDRKNACILTGYVFPDSVAAQALKIEKGRDIVLDRYNKRGGYMYKEAIKVACEIYSFSLSAHDYQ